MLRQVRWALLLGGSLLCGVFVLPWAYYLAPNPWPWFAQGVAYCACWSVVHELRRIHREGARKRRPTEADFSSGLYPF